MRNFIGVATVRLSFASNVGLEVVGRVIISGNVLLANNLALYKPLAISRFIAYPTG